MYETAYKNAHYKADYFLWIQFQWNNIQDTMKNKTILICSHSWTEHEHVVEGFKHCDYRAIRLLKGEIKVCACN